MISLRREGRAEAANVADLAEFGSKILAEEKD
jgi:hypothetical protein